MRRRSPAGIAFIRLLHCDYLRVRVEYAPRLDLQPSGTIMRAHSLALLLTASVTGIGSAVAQPTGGELYIVQAKSSGAAATRLHKEGAEAHRELDVINAVTAYLTPAQLASLRSDSSVRVFDDRAVGLRGSWSYPFNSTSNYFSSWWKFPQQTTTPSAAAS